MDVFMLEVAGSMENIDQRDQPEAHEYGMDSHTLRRLARVVHNAAQRETMLSIYNAGCFGVQ